MFLYKEKKIKKNLILHSVSKYTYINVDPYFFKVI